MEVFDLPAEFYLGDAESKDMDIDEAQDKASTFGEDQDDDPKQTPQELAYVRSVLGFDPSKWADEDQE